MPKVREYPGVSEGDQTWLGSTRGIRTNRTEVLDLSAFTEATHYPDGFIPSGTAVALVGDVLVPYNSVVPGTGATGAEILAGFVFTDQPVYEGQTEDLNVPLMDHGRVRTSRLPGPAFVIPSPANDNTTVVFVD